MYGRGWGGGWRRRAYYRHPMWGPYRGFGFPGCGCLVFLILGGLRLCWLISGGFFHPFWFYRY